VGFELGTSKAEITVLHLAFKPVDRGKGGSWEFLVQVLVEDAPVGAGLLVPEFVGQEAWLAVAPMWAGADTTVEQWGIGR